MNRTCILANIITRLFLIYAVAVSYMHIVDASLKLGLHGWVIWTVPIAIDGFALLGMLFRSKGFSQETQKMGKRVQYGAGLVSLAANVYAGENRGEQIHGALVVMMFLACEYMVARMKPAPSVDELIAARQKELNAQRNAERRARTAARKAETAAKAQPKAKPEPKAKPAASKPRVKATPTPPPAPAPKTSALLLPPFATVPA